MDPTPPLFDPSQAQSGPSAGAGPAASTGAAPSAQTPAQGPTVEQLLQALTDRLETLERTSQRSVDRAISSLRRELGITPARHLTDAAQAAGLTVTADQVNQLVQQLQQRGVLPAAASEETGEEPEASAGDPAAPAQDVTRRGWQIAQGYQLQQGDPELQFINTQAETAEEYLATIHLAGLMKRQRLGQQLQPPGPNGQAPNPGQMPALFPAGGPAPQDRSKVTRDQAFGSEWARVRRG